MTYTSSDFAALTCSDFTRERERERSLLLDLESAPTKFIYMKGGIPGHTLDAHGIIIGCFRNRLGPDVRTRASTLYKINQICQDKTIDHTLKCS
jgi:hypothetical protein